MGQCSTLPAENHEAETMRREQKHRLNDGGRKESLDFNVLAGTGQDPYAAKHATQSRRTPKGARQNQMPPGYYHPQPPQQRDPEKMESTPMDIDGSREEIPLPPAGAQRTRCYKLNLDSEINLSSSQRQQICLGPFTEPPPYLTYTSSEDSSADITATEVAIRTAQIFRGITISRDGTILSQNARATRSNRGANKNKRGEKSRQAAKIDKAKDLVEEAAMANADTTDETKLVSLVIVGEYDDMKQLVRDGSRKLREADGLPDEALLQLNRFRTPMSTKSSRTPSRMSRRGSRGSSTMLASSPKPILPPNMPQSAPPKLKSHPRDKSNRRGRGESGRGMRLDSCHDFPALRKRDESEDDWSHAWNIWNCGGGGGGGTSPLQPSSPNQHNRVEGRNDVGAREGGISSRAG